MPYIPSQPAYLGPIAHSQTLPAPVCHVQQTPPQVELLLQFVPVLQDSSELLKRIKALAVLVSHVITSWYLQAIVLQLVQKS